MFRNALTGHVYSGNNQEALTLAAAMGGVPENEFEVAGFRQWLELGRVVAKGQHGTKILMVLAKKDEGQVKAGIENPERRKVLKTATVFFRSQTVELQAKGEEVAAA